MNFSWKKELCQFLNIPIFHHRAKNQKRLMIHSCENCRTDGWTDNGDFIGQILLQQQNSIAARIKETLMNVPIMRHSQIYVTF